MCASIVIFSFYFASNEFFNFSSDLTLSRRSNLGQILCNIIKWLVIKGYYWSHPLFPDEGLFVYIYSDPIFNIL